MFLLQYEISEKQLFDHHFAELFLRHFVDGVPYGELVEPFGLTPSQAASAARDVAFELRRCLRTVLSRDGITEADLGPELALIEQMLRPEGRR